MHPELKDHPDYFKKEIVQLGENVYQAFGFAASNVYMVIGVDGIIIIDTSETTTAAKNILAEFRKITDLPVKAIILTHSHRDHVSGASVFAEGENPEILASDKSSEDPLLNFEIVFAVAGATSITSDHLERDIWSISDSFSTLNNS